MADAKISALTTGSAPVATDEFVVARSGAPYKLTYTQLMTLPSGGQILGPAGSASVPPLAVGATNTGWYYNSPWVLLTKAGTDVLALNHGGTTGIQVSSAGYLQWSNAGVGGSSDAGIARVGAGSLRVTNGSTGNGYLSAALFNLMNAGNTQNLLQIVETPAVNMASGTTFNWSNSATDATSTKDTGLARSAAGVVKVTDGSSGYGTLLTGNGAVGAPAYTFSGATTTGLYTPGSSDMVVTTGGTGRVYFNSAGAQLNSALQFAWSSGSVGAASDTGLARKAAGVVQVSDGSTGNGQLCLETVGSQRIASGKVTLTEAGGAEVVAVVTTASSDMTGGRFDYTIRATDATDLAVRSGSFIFNAIDAAGTVTGAITTVTSEANDGSTLTSTNSKTLTYAIATNVATAHKFKITFNIDSDMVVSAASITWTMTLNGPGTVSTS